MTEPGAVELRERNAEIRRLIQNGQLERLNIDERSKLLLEHIQKVGAMLDAYDELARVSQTLQGQIAEIVEQHQKLKEETEGLKRMIGASDDAPAKPRPNLKVVDDDDPNDQ